MCGSECECVYVGVSVSVCMWSECVYVGLSVSVCECM